MFRTRFFWKSCLFFVFKQSCQKSKKALTMLEVVEVVKSCWATVAHPWRGRGGGYGGVNNFTYKSRLLFHAGVESKSNTETGPITTLSLRQTWLKKDRQIPHWSHLINVGFYSYKETENRTLGITGAPNDNFLKIICSEDDLRSRIFGSFSEKFLACLPLLGFSNFKKSYNCPFLTDFYP